MLDSVYPFYQDKSLSDVHEQKKEWKENLNRDGSLRPRKKSIAWTQCLKWCQENGSQRIYDISIFFIFSPSVKNVALTDYVLSMHGLALLRLTQIYHIAIPPGTNGLNEIRTSGR